MPTACAMEMIHTYSLVHDDLPAMDNDDFRRGVPTNHKVFGEAMAILAGDALLTLAFGLLAENFRAAARRAGSADVLADVADAAGSAGMVGGQVADLESEGKQVDRGDRGLHPRCTRRARSSAPRSGSAPSSAGRRPRRSRALGVAGRRLGLAFQIVDDILDVVGSPEELGKTAGKDQAQQKATYPALHGHRRLARPRRSSHRARRRRALADARPAAPSRIRALGRFILERKA